MTKHLLMASAVVATLFFVAPASAVELTTNGDFETGDFTGWKVFDMNTIPSVPNGGVISISSDTPDASNWSGKLNSNVGSPSNPTLKQERVGQGIVQNNQDVTISFDAKGSEAIGGVFSIQFFTEAGGGGASSVTNLVSGVGLTSDWQPYNFVVNTGGVDVSGGVTLQISAISGGAANGFSEIYIDNASMSVVPEPGSLAALAVGGIGLVARRRRRS